LTSMPWSANACPACSKFSDDCSSALDGMQPTLVQVPPGAGLPSARSSRRCRRRGSPAAPRVSPRCNRRDRHRSRRRRMLQPSRTFKYPAKGAPGLPALP
jgi:hypothetical protein